MAVVTLSGAMRKRCGTGSREPRVGAGSRDWGREPRVGAGALGRWARGDGGPGLSCCSGSAARSEVLAAEAVSCLNRALSALRDIWEEIGIPEELRLERTGAAKNHIKVSGAPGRAGGGGGLGVS